jgi:hypothetical protein
VFIYYYLAKWKIEQNLGKYMGNSCELVPLIFCWLRICIFLENISWLIFKYPPNVVKCVKSEFC